MQGFLFVGTFMSVTTDNKFNFYDVKLVSTNKSGKFYFEAAKNRSRVYEVSEDLFKTMLVAAAQRRNTSEDSSALANSFDYLFDQLEMTEEIFTALLYPEWINENKE
ncbi:hypothetical protein pEaSNUABM50_00325 [Erwinia phage pEa_SNUABM_50]|uniref:Uncharacterized protein n=4 Tax=Eneladusvirus BF TaxID=2560751 RepID=A0A7L8ZNT2_9CAUD|nr:hypothetical protein FDH34_gp329 [Serratia phage BF]QOI71266.1 hypothetical protein pEaSNUABM12_00328 [Erwinia phage pEa_SNUABM_12]QOI71810.1 hypothetical protein pEaSNUABM47_00326 [Erwinia phage pEa_SNUABM_47]QOI72349.1 hypothetical protein pEaSNUABM50_00325 [Erwinia phage pEa_SNUABM_50]QXO11475.1 hypothetical protein pEaSNUABM19_00329 [Erwinia phage pEa_SNUABM_19]QXO12023.1 hypothetical protein pEaSNUABM44_00327 [Erwinia phage pEa_SNUABM_44]QXO12576.1 hypothetical protein pEaSNUABM49_003